MFKPVFYGVAFYIDPFIARDISKQLTKTIFTLLDSGDQVAMVLHANNDNDNQIFVE